MSGEKRRIQVLFCLHSMGTVWKKAHTGREWVWTAQTVQGSWVKALENGDPVCGSRPNALIDYCQDNSWHLSTESEVSPLQPSALPPPPPHLCAPVCLAVGQLILMGFDWRNVRRATERKEDNGCLVYRTRISLGQNRTADGWKKKSE